jgi:hypothetical protein
VTPLGMDGDGCEHFGALDGIAEPRAEVSGATKILRVRPDRGHLGCCESHHARAREHARATGHQDRPRWKGGAFVYCHEDGYL